MKIENYFMIAIMILSIVLGALLMELGQMTYKKYSESKYSFNPDEEFNCSNLGFEDSITCMNNYVQSIYNYTVRDENEYNSTDGELEDLKINGGDCYDWNNLYVKLAKNISLLGTHLSIYRDDKSSGHRIAIVWNNDLSEYCVLDQRSIIGCSKLGGNNETV